MNLGCEEMWIMDGNRFICAGVSLHIVWHSPLRVLVRTSSVYKAYAGNLLGRSLHRLLLRRDIGLCDGKPVQVNILICRDIDEHSAYNRIDPALVSCAMEDGSEWFLSVLNFQAPNAYGVIYATRGNNAGVDWRGCKVSDFLQVINKVSREAYLA